MLGGFLLTLAVAIVVFATQCALSAPIPREPLDAVWQDKMLAGAPANLHHDGTRLSTDPSFEPSRLGSRDWAHGDLFWTAFTNEGIIVSDTREHCALGLWRFGGWELYGGPVARIVLLGATIDLYGKIVMRLRPYFPILPHEDRPEKRGYEFYLVVYRSSRAAKGSIVHAWTFPIGSQLAKTSDGRPMVNGSLEYDSTSKTATVTITGLARPFQERIALDTHGAK